MARPRAFGPYEVRLIKSAYRAGWTINAIARDWDVSWRTVQLATSPETVRARFNRSVRTHNRLAQRARRAASKHRK